MFNPILYYGEDPRAGKGQSPSGISLSGITVTEGANVPDFPCPKPLGAWKWLLNKASLEGETVLDPFMGSGTTLVAAKRLAQRGAVLAQPPVPTPAGSPPLNPGPILFLTYCTL